MKKNSIGYLVFALGLITLVCACVLGALNQVTSPLIAENNVKTRNAAMEEIMPGADFNDLDAFVEGTKETPAITGVYEAIVDGQIAGYCVQVQPSGFGGTMTMIVGVSTDGSIAGVKVTGHAETPGLGAKAQSDSAWIAQFAGIAADGNTAVTKDGGEISSITGATITSRAVTNGINTAADYVASLG